MIFATNHHDDISLEGLCKHTDAFLAELLHAEGAHVEPNTLQNLVTYQSKKKSGCYVTDHMYIRLYVHMSIPKKIREKHHYHSHIFDFGHSYYG